MNPRSDRLTIGNGGWVLFKRTGDPDRYFRLVLHAERLAIAESFTVWPDGQPLSAEVLREVPFQSFIRWVNAPDIRALIVERLNLPGPQLHRAAEALATTYGHADHWVAAMLQSQIPGSGVPVPERPRRRQAVAPPEPVDPTLELPTTKRFPVQFYREVERIYDQLKAAGDPAPAKTIARTNDVGYDRVRKWLSTAKKNRGV